MKKEKAFIILSDLDNTFLPMDSKTMESFVNFAKDIKEKHDINVKFCPVTGRPPQFTSGVMHSFKGAFERKGLQDVVEIGGADQGGVLVDYKYPYKSKMLARENCKELIEKIQETLFSSKIGKYFEKDEDTRAVSVFMLNDKYLKKWSQEKITDIVKEAKEYIEDKFEGEVKVTPWKHFLEATPKEVGKDKAASEIFSHYQRQYDIVGMTYSGDAPNDMKAIKFLTKFSEIPGISSHVFLPSNAVEDVTDPKIEQWKERLGDKAKGRVIHVADEKYFEGVLKLMKQKYEEGKLFGEGSSIKRTTDDLNVHYGKSNKEQVEVKSEKSKDDSFLNKMKKFEKGEAVKNNNKGFTL